jgi:CRP-like cAMP-binding protein
VTVRAAEEAHPVELGEGEVLGESCILAEGRRSADVEVARRLRALRIERAALVPLIDRWPRLGELMLEVAIRRRLSNWLAHSPLMAPFGGPERVAVGRLFEARYVAAGTVLIAEGREPAGIVLPLSGRIVLHGGGRPADEVVPGGSLILGYQELIDARPAAFEARAAIDMIALWLPASAWHELGQRHPEPRARFEQHVRGI